jgi:hypothetical protein
MRDDSPTLYECENCAVTFSTRIFEIARAFEKVSYSRALPSVAVRNSESLANFCSADCRTKGRDAVMARYRVPVLRVGIGPIEPCARCRGPVDMTEFHITFTESEMVERDVTILEPVDVDYLAVLCRNCQTADAVRVIGSTDINAPQKTINEC